MDKQAALQEELLKAGFNITTWAKTRGFKPNSVHKYLLRFTKSNRLPRSPEVYKVLKAIEEDFGINLMKK